MTVVVTKLNNGVLLPALHLGTYRLSKEDAPSVLQAAVNVGYRALDCAAFYKNQKEIGEVIANTLDFSKGFGSASGDQAITAGFDTVSEEEFESNSNSVPHKAQNSNPQNNTSQNNAKEAQNTDHHPPRFGTRFFLTTKVWPDDYRTDEAVRNSVDTSLANLGHMDLLLMHWPGELVAKGETDEHSVEEARATRARVWLVLESYYKAGRVRALGVSNFMAKHLEPFVAEIKARGGIMPTVNQVEGSVWTQGFRGCEEICRKHDIRISCYRPLGGDKHKYGKMNQAHSVTQITDTFPKSLGLSDANILTRWVYEKGFVVIVKSSNPVRIEQNKKLFSFKLSTENLKILDDLFETEANSEQNPFNIN